MSDLVSESVQEPSDATNVGSGQRLDACVPSDAHSCCVDKSASDWTPQTAASECVESDEVALNSHQTVDCTVAEGALCCGSFCFDNESIGLLIYS